ncbi:MAG: DNA translocase FtsK 4TM domain-containing protein [Proteobacteria bacterium]|nr:DNA translocase FtsK 4TM domain-containing protein [Pseudomonadota bacterium]
MRKEITGTLLFFLVILTLVSLLSYSPGDPSIHHAGAEGQIQNLFGMLGAYFSSFLVGLFGIGSFWVPILLLLASVRFLGQKNERGLFLLVIGGLVLVVVTGTFMSLVSSDNFCTLFGHRFSSGGLVGIPLKSFLLHYTNPTGSYIIIAVLVVIGLILATRFSIVTFARKCLALVKNCLDMIGKVRAGWKAWKEARKAEKELKKMEKADRDMVKMNRRLEEKKRPGPEIKITAAKPKTAKVAPVVQQEEFSFMTSGKNFKLPGVGFLNDPEKRPSTVDDETLRMRSKLLEKKLEDFGVMGTVSAVSPGPVITTFEYKPAPGVKINKIVNLSDDLALALRAISIRIIAPIPGKDAIGIEIPNETRESVCFKEIVTSSAYINSKSPLNMCLGHDIVGNPVSAELDKMPHLLIAGATGAGKSVGLNAMISSILFRATPDEVRMIMIDPKRIELSVYDGIPHLITPVVTDMKKATNALFWAVREMENRYELLAELKCRNIGQYNKKVEKEFPDKKEDDETVRRHKKLPFIVIIIDELADLMMVASRDVEVSLTRLAQMARACGIHIVLATQRPSVDVLTGIIKANFPTRISFQVSSKTDSRTIIDSNGAEALLGMGDMLYLPPGTAKLQRIHGAFISDEELNSLIEFWKGQKEPEYDESILQAPPEKNEENGSAEDYDEKYDEAVALVTRTRQASISSVQRHLRIGYNRAARIIETMEKEGLIGPADGAKPREILAGSYDNIP